MPNGIQIAVKRLFVQSMQGKEQFLNEVKLVAKIQDKTIFLYYISHQDEY